MTTLYAASSGSGNQIDDMWFRDVEEQKIAARVRPSQELRELYVKAIGSLLAERQHGLAVTIDRLNSLLVPDGTEEDEKPDFETLGRVKDVLNHAYLQIADRFFPRGWVSCIDGDIRVEWENGAKHVRLYVPSNPQVPGYIYVQDGAQYGTIAVTPENLAVSLVHLLRA